MNNNINARFSMIDSVTDKLMELYGTDRDQWMFPTWGFNKRETRYAYRDIVSQSDPNFGKNFNIYIPAAGDFIAHMHLVINVTAGAGATNPRFKNEIASALFERVTFFYQGNILQIMYPDQLSIMEGTQDQFEKATMRVDRMGATTPANRIILAQNATQYMLPLNSFLDQMSFPISLLNKEIRVEFQVRDKVNVTAADANFNLLTGLNIDDCFLRIKYVYGDKESLNKLAQYSVSGFGLMYPFLDNMWQRNNLAIGSTTARVLLSGIKGLVSYFVFCVRYADDVDDRTGNDAGFNTYVPWRSFNVTDNAVRIFPAENDEMTILENRMIRVLDAGAYVPAALPNQITDYRGVANWAHYATNYLTSDDEKYNNGYYNFSATSAAFLNIDFGFALPREAYVDVWVKHHNSLQLVNGTVKAYSLH